MPENKNCTNGLSFDTRGTVCIDTYRVLDCCRDRDCFEDARVYLSCDGEEQIANATSVRTRSAKTLWAFVGVDEVPFNCGFYRITVRYYIKVELEVCSGIGRTQCITGLVIVEKEVILYGGEGSVTSFSSSPENNYCGIGDFDTVGNNDPVAIVETVEPVVLATRLDCECPGCAACNRNEVFDIPRQIACQLDGEIVASSSGPRVYISLGLFSVVRIQRPEQLLVQATDYSVPEKECFSKDKDDNPCALFRGIAFPVSQFRTSTQSHQLQSGGSGGCGCGRNG